LLTSAP
jgi:hypothetical protein